LTWGFSATCQILEGTMNEHEDRPDRQNRDVRNVSREPDLSELDDPIAGSPDREAGEDYEDQRPITDNKAGG
jgi:hypothetical protein